MTRWMREHPIYAYFLLALLFSWSIGIPLIFVRKGWTDLPIPYWTHYLVSFGPALAGLIMTAIDSGRDGLRNLWRRITYWRVNEDYANFALFSVPMLFFVVVFTRRFITGTCTSLRELAQVNYLPYLSWLVLPLWLTFGFGEEIGWRGYALPRLQKKMDALKASLLLGVGWVILHLPEFFYHQNYMRLDWLGIAGVVLGMLGSAVVLTWLYNGTGGSILMTAAWYALFELFSSSSAGGGLLPIVLNLAVIAWALVLIGIRKSWGLMQQEKQVVSGEGAGKLKRLN